MEPTKNFEGGAFENLVDGNSWHTYIEEKP
jgi:hypothetical protein